jgi:hypothetical protein
MWDICTEIADKGRKSLRIQKTSKNDILPSISEKKSRNKDCCHVIITKDVKCDHKLTDVRSNKREY